MRDPQEVIRQTPDYEAQWELPLLYYPNRSKWRFVPTLVIFLVVLLLAFTAKAEQFLAAGVFCKTPEYATAFLTEWDGSNSREIITGINISAGDEACMLAKVSVEEIERTVFMTTGTGTWQMVKVNVWAISQGQFTVYLPKPVEMYTFAKIEGKPA